VEKGRSRSRDDLAPGTSRWLQVLASEKGRTSRSRDLALIR